MKKVLMIGILSLALLWCSDAKAQKMLQVKGSDTLINLVQRLAEVYMEKNPGSYIAVTGGGSGTGVSALINRKCDIANSSRLMKASEYEQAMKLGAEVNRVVVAIDGLSVIVNPANSIDRLTVDEIGRIFKGEITNWSELGGSNTPITLYGRQSNSGTYVFFRDDVIKGEYSQKMNHMNGNAQIVEAVKQDLGGIGYVGVGYLNDVAGVTIAKVASKKGAEYTSPLDTAAVESGLYPLSRPLNQYISGKPTGLAKSFLEFELSPEGQRIVKEEGFFPITSDYADLHSKAGLQY